MSKINYLLKIRIFKSDRDARNRSNIFAIIYKKRERQCPMNTRLINLPETLTITQEQFKKIVTANRDLRLEKNAQGQLIIMPPTGGSTGKKNQQDDFAPICPDFVIELRSKTDSLKPLREKMQEYVENGLKLGWLIDPKGKTVEIYRRNREVEILKHPISLSGENILPNFVMDLQKVFD